MSKSKYLLKNMGILTISNFSSKILVFLLVPLYTSVLSTAQYGAYELSVSTATLLYPILSLNIVDGVMRFAMDKTCEKRQIASIGLKFVFISIVIFGIGVMTLHVTKLWPSINGLERYVFLYYVSYVINQFMIQFTKGLEKVKDMAVAGVLSTAVTLLANVLFLVVFRWGLIGFFYANILAQIMSGIYLAIKIQVWQYINIRELNKELQQDMLKYSIPLIATTVGWWINSTADRYVVAFMIGVSANGILSVSYKIPQIINTLQGVFTQAWQISAVKEYGENDTAVFYGDTFIIINLLMCMTCSLLILLTKPIAYVLYSKNFFVAWRYVPYLLIASVLNCASGLLGPILSAQKNSRAMMWSAIFGAGVNIVLNIMLVFCVGIQGTTIATMICSYVIYLVRKVAVGNEIRIERYSKIILTWILLVVQASIECFISNYCIEIVIMILIVFVNYNSVKKTWSIGKRILGYVIKRSVM